MTTKSEETYQTLNDRIEDLETAIARLRPQSASRRWSRRMTAVTAMGLVAVVMLAAGVSFSQTPLCAQTLPAPMVTFCAQRPALAAAVNGNFQWVVNKVGTGAAGVETQGLVVRGRADLQGTVSGLDLECEQVEGSSSATGDDSPSIATCSSGYVVTGCSCYSPYAACSDGARRTSATECTAFNTNGGGGVRGYAVCCRVR